MLLESTRLDPIRICFVLFCFFFLVVVVFWLSFVLYFFLEKKNFNDLTVVAFPGRQQFFSTTYVKKRDYDHDDEISLFWECYVFSLLRDQHSLQAIWIWLTIKNIPSKISKWLYKSVQQTRWYFNNGKLRSDIERKIWEKLTEWCSHLTAQV